MKKILIIEDDKTLNDTLSYRLGQLDYNVKNAYTIAEAYSIVKKTHLDLIILDVNLPDGNGFDAYYKIKELSHSGIIFLTCNDLKEDILRGYDLGADDYITKPFTMEILERKIHAIMNRLTGSSSKHIYRDDHLYINFLDQCASLHNKPIEFTPLEYKTLEQLILHADQIMTRQILLDQLWDIDGNFVEETSLNSIICRIRRKIESKELHYIKTVYSIGYMWRTNGYV